MKNISIKKTIIILITIIPILLTILFIGIINLRINNIEAQNIALQKTGGGEIINEKIDIDGLLNDYSYTIRNGENWYNIEINSFGKITEFENGIGEYPIYDD